VRRRGGRVVRWRWFGGWRRGCGLAAGSRAAAAVHQKPERTRRISVAASAPRSAPTGLLPRAPHRSRGRRRKARWSGPSPRRGWCGCWCSLARQRLRHGAANTAWVCAARCRPPAPRIPALERGSQLLLGRPVREDQHDGRGTCACAASTAARTSGPRAHRSPDLAAFGARHAAQGLLEGFDRPHHSLSPEGLAQFEQKIIAAGESGDVYHRPESWGALREWRVEASGLREAVVGALAT